jgi:hypothetical protein
MLIFARDYFIRDFQYCMHAAGLKTRGLVDRLGRHASRKNVAPVFQSFRADQTTARRNTGGNRVYISLHAAGDKRDNSRRPVERIADRLLR